MKKKIQHQILLVSALLLGCPAGPSSSQAQTSVGTHSQDGTFYPRWQEIALPYDSKFNRLHRTWVLVDGC